jgi:hypothetical protein
MIAKTYRYLASRCERANVDEIARYRGARAGAVYVASGGEDRPNLILTYALLLPIAGDRGAAGAQQDDQFTSSYA